MLVDLRTPVGLAPLDLPFSAPQGVYRICKRWPTLKLCNAWGAKSNAMYDQEQPTQFNS
jgi:hypothetical protein